jgi:hypothetical protein
VAETDRRVGRKLNCIRGEFLECSATVVLRRGRHWALRKGYPGFGQRSRESLGRTEKEIAIGIGRCRRVISSSRRFDFKVRMNVLLALGNRPAIQRLKRAGSIVIVRHVLIDLCFRELDRVFHHVPHHFFVTKRARQRSRKSVEAAIRRQQVGGIDLRAGNLVLFASIGHMFQEDLHDRVFFAGHDGHLDNQEP